MELFHHVMLTEKLTLIIVLIILSFINQNNTYVAQYPRKFMIDNLVTGALGAMAFFIIAQMRGSDKGLGVAIATFLLLFMTNVLMEFAGLNDTKNLKVQSEFNKYRAATLTVIVAGLLILTVMAFMSNVPLEGSNLLVESIILGASSGLGAGLVAYDHGAKTKEILGIGGGAAVFFGLLHTALQKGGFYSIIF